MTANDQKTILFIEDEVIITMNKKMSLEKCGYKVFIANTGKEAIEIFQNNVIDLILVDIDIEKGIAVIETAQEILKRYDIPLLFVYSDIDEDIIKKTEKVASYGYVTKNSEIIILDASIKAALKLFEANNNFKKELNECKQVDTTLENDKEFFSKTLDCMLEGYQIIGFDWCYLYVNDAVAKHGRMPKDKLLGYTMMEVYPGIEKTDVFARIKDCMENRTSHHLENLFKYPDGSSGWFDLSIQPSPEGTVVLSIDITERKRAEDALKENEESLSITLQSIGDAVIATDIDGLITRMNNMAELMTGWNFIEAKSKPLVDIFNIINAETRNVVENPVKKVLETGTIAGLANHTILIGRDGTEYQIADSAAPIKDKEGNIKGVILVFSDITEKYAAEEALRKKDEKYRCLFENAGDSIFIHDENSVILAANPSACERLGYSMTEMLSLTVGQVDSPQDAELVPARIAKLMEQSFIKFETTHRHKNGSLIPFEVNSRFIDWDGRPAIMSICRDITDRKLVEEKNKILLAEKELMLKEVHHRIKNNMNTVAGLMYLQAATLKEPSAIAALKDARSRVLSMMILYDKLYCINNFNKLSLKEYLSPLVDEIINNFPNKGIVKIEKNISDFSLDAKRLSDLGIIINEILTNIMKYAFTGRDEGLIMLSAIAIDNRMTITISDNGIGILESVDITNSVGFGLQLVDMMTKALYGTMKIERNNGTKFILEFNL